MAKRMLIDSTHAEETRVVVVNGTRLEEFDVETSTKKQLKGNIYLAKIVRVEPSLQAAFVDYGGNRHGFLAFSEIHPDYYQIPVADRQALLAEQREVMKQSAAASSADFGDIDDHDVEAAPAVIETAGASADDSHDHTDEQTNAAGSVMEILPPDAPLAEGALTDVTEGAATETVPADILGEHHVDTLSEDGDQDDSEHPEGERRRYKSLRQYKIQEVIKRRQIVLVQVVKEERGNKGAALTTYLSLAGRYCVLMPNTARGGGVSRKITNATDRKRLKTIANEMEIPDGMAVIVRTAGSERTKPEIRRDYEYLLRLWDSVRSLTLQSVAPALVYEEANLIKRSIRDLYSRDIDDILVDGEEGYRLAKDFMRMLTPSHAKKVQLYKDPTMPLFQRFQIENQLDAMHSQVVQLRSGGYLVINQTEALVAIDVNSGRSTKERHIEETALKTNLEAADEVARQLRLRDLAGLIVIDFIDMEETRNNHAVERRLKEAMRFDRARIQLGKISPFGLMELSRQRLRPSLMETSFQPCPHCGGTGMVRSVESSSVHVLRAIEEEGIRRRSSEVTVTVHPSIALYILNQKRDALADIEERYGFRVYLLGDDTLIPPASRMERVKSETPIEIPAARPISSDLPIVADPDDEEVIEEESVEIAEEEDNISHSNGVKDEDGEGRGRRRRRRRRRGRRDENGEETGADEDGNEDSAEDLPSDENDADAEADAEDGEDGVGEDGELADGQPSPRRRRRGKRGGRRRNRGRDAAGADGEGVDGEGSDEDVSETTSDQVSDAIDDASSSAVSVTDEAVATSSETVVVDVAPVIEQPVASENTPLLENASVASDTPAVVEEEAPVKPKRTRAPRKKKEDAVAAESATDDAAKSEEAPAKPKRTRAPRKKKEDAVAAESATVEVQAQAEPVQTEAVKVETATVAPIVETVTAPVAVSVPETPAPEALVPETPAPETPVIETEIKPEVQDPASPPRRGWWSR